MDILNHAATGVAISHLTGYRKWWQMGTVGLFGALPDVLGYAEKVIKHDPNAWNWYLALHGGANEVNIWSAVLTVAIFCLPFSRSITSSFTRFFILVALCGCAINLHIGLDSFCHGDNPWWKWPGMWFEVGTWFALVLYGLYAYLVSKTKVE